MLPGRHPACSGFYMKTIIFGLTLFATLMAHAGEKNPFSKRQLIRESLEKIQLKEPLNGVIEKWNELFDHQNLRRDDIKDRNNWRSLFPIKESFTQEIEGKRTYFHLFRKNYRYGIRTDEIKNQITIELNLHFYPSKTYLSRLEKLHRTDHPDKKYYPQLEPLMKEVEKNLKLAEKTWNSQAPSGVKFQFRRVEEPNLAHYSIKLVTVFAALYDRFIMAPAPSYMLEHEIGHMLGLDDEYSMVTSNVLPIHTLTNMMKAKNKQRSNDEANFQDMRCNLESIMCLREKIYPYHFDHVLGRIKIP
jgi:hypothetical protein